MTPDEAGTPVRRAAARHKTAPSSSAWSFPRCDRAQGLSQGVVLVARFSGSTGSGRNFTDLHDLEAISRPTGSGAAPTDGARTAA